MKKLIIILVISALLSGTAYSMRSPLLQIFYGAKPPVGAQAGNNLAFTADKLTFGADYLIF